MKRNGYSVFFLIALLLGVTAFWVSAPVKSQNDSVKFGSVFVEEIFDNYDRVQELQEKLKEETDAYLLKRNQLEEEFRSEVENFNVQKDMMDEQAALQKRVDLQEKQRGMIAELREMEENIKTLEQEGTQPILDELNTTIQQFARNNGYDFIFKRKNMAYVDEKYDLTQNIIDELDKLR